MGIVVQDADSDNPIYTNVQTFRRFKSPTPVRWGGLCFVSVMGATGGGQKTFYNGTIEPGQSPVTVTLNNTPHPPPTTSRSTGPSRRLPKVRAQQA